MGKKVKFWGIFRDKFAEQIVAFAGIFKENFAEKHRNGSGDLVFFS